jgi:hypothetical protein
MKNVSLLSVICLFLILVPTAWANDRADWQDYTGHYVIATEHLEETVEIVLQGDSVLRAFSALGEVLLTYVGKDRFEVPQYGGVIVFERDEKQTVIACKVSIAAIEVEDIKARKL